MQTIGHSTRTAFLRYTIVNKRDLKDAARLLDAVKSYKDGYKKGKRFRGGPTDQPQDSHLPGIPPQGEVSGAPTGPNWCGHHWSDWVPMEDVAVALKASAVGLYRISGADQKLVYGTVGTILGTAKAK